MPELPDVALYLEALTATVGGRELRRVRVLNPFVLRSVTPPLASVEGRRVGGVSRIGKRIVLSLEPVTGDAGGAETELFLVFHLMIAGRIRWRPAAGEARGRPRPSPRLTLASLEFEHGVLYFTEAGSTRRASLHVIAGRAALQALNPGGVEPLEVSAEAFRAALSSESHTVKRALTDPHLVSGIGNAYSDEILHAARLSPLKLTRHLSDGEWARLYEATRTTLTNWIERLREAAGDDFPEAVTAFRVGMAVHGRFGQPCPACGAPVQRIVYADNECHYCARCQTGGRRLADRSLSRLLKDAWPRTID